jgi:hypothetical protein
MDQKLQTCEGEGGDTYIVQWNHASTLLDLTRIG